MASEVLELSPDEVRTHAAQLGLQPLDAAWLSPTHPFMSVGGWRLFVSTGAVGSAARVVASIDPRQQHLGRRVGCIGFISEGAASVPRGTIEEVILAAIGWLEGEGARTIRCPVQFSTWFGHRAIIDGFPEQGGHPAFALEPVNGPALPAVLLACGFAPAARSVSCLVPHDPLIEGARSALDRLRAVGLRDRPLDLARLDTELDALHQISTAVFEGSWGFSPVSFEEFAALYRPFARTVNPDLVRVLESPVGDPVGFAFAVPEDPQRPDIGGVVIKTLGLLPAARRRYPGAGLALTALVHLAARERGHTYAIHALMAEGGSAHRLSTRWGRVIRTYATFEQATGTRR